MSNETLTRCKWVNKNPLYIAYHDQEWGVPVHDDRKLFEFLILEGVQAGLSWETVLNKRENYRRAFDGFDPAKVAAYTPDDVARLMENAGMVRNQAKILAAINNAQKFLEVQREFGTFDHYIWQFIDSPNPIENQFTRSADLPAQTPQSLAMSKALSKRGFKFVGPVICYALMQAIGMVNDHTLDCFKRQ